MQEVQDIKKTISSIEDLSDDAQFYVNQYKIPLKQLGKNYLRMTQVTSDADLTPDSKIRELIAYTHPIF